MTVVTETGKVPATKERRLASVQTRRLQTREVDEREGQVTTRGPGVVSRVRRDRITPSRELAKEGMASKVAVSTQPVDNGEPRRSKLRSSKGNETLSVHTKWDPASDSCDDDTPRTEASTPSNATSLSNTNSVRGQTDLRSPGQRKSPRVASSEEAPLPDFITQTDKNGNAVTPRSATAIQQARVEHPSGAVPHLHVGKNGKLTEEQGTVDVCTETLLDSMRILCCCRLPEDSTEKSSSAATRDLEVHQIKEDVDERPRLLPKLHPDDRGKKCLVLDLDETLVHSSFRAVPGADFVIPVQIEDVVHFVYVAKRPGVDEFLTEMAKHYELVIYTASLNKYADPLLDLLDPNRVIRTRLFRESCVYFEGNYVKDLSLLDRDLSQSIIIDNSPSSYAFHPTNAIDCSSFIDDPRDRELDQIAAFLKGVKDVRDVRGLTQKWREWPNVSIEHQ